MTRMWRTWILYALVLGVLTAIGMSLNASSLTERAILITVPNASTIWMPGALVTAQWNSIGIDRQEKMKAEYSVDGGETWVLIGTSIGNDGTLTDWAAPDVESTQCLLRISSVETPEILDVSEAFTIDALQGTSPPREIILTVPNASTIWMPGALVTAQWNSMGIDRQEKMKAEYSVDGGETWVLIGTSIGNDGTLTDWAVPDVESTQCLLRISSGTTPDVFDVSDRFSIDAEFGTAPPRTISIAVPDASTEWVSGTQATVRWDTERIGIYEKMRAEYSTDGGATWTLIATSIGNDGTLTDWTIPSVESEYCRLRISSVHTPDVFDTSDRFSIVGNEDEGIRRSLSHLALGSLTGMVLTRTFPGSPVWFVAGEEAWLQWRSTGIDRHERMKAEYTVDGGATWHLIKVSEINDGFVRNWTLPVAQSDQFRVRISSIETPDVFDVSDEYYLQTEPPSLEIVSPNSLTTWIAGSTVDVLWDSSAMSTATDVNVSYSTDEGMTWTSIAGKIPNNGSVSWNVPDLQTNQCRVRISLTRAPGVYSESQPFTIQREGDPIQPRSIAVIRPDGTTTEIAGSRGSAKWVTAGIPIGSEESVEIEISVDGGVTWRTLGNTPNTGYSGTWRVPDVCSDECLLRITAVETPSVSDTSQMFSIHASDFAGEERAIVVSKPNSSSAWIAGTSGLVQWDSTGLDVGEKVRVEYTLNNGATWILISEAADNDEQQMPWTIPYMATNTCRLRIGSVLTPSVFDLSASFSISIEADSPEPRAIAVTAPDTTTTLIAGAQASLRWETTGIDSSEKMRAEYSVNGGDTWKEISHELDNVGVFDAWLLPDLNSIDCRVRISAVETPNVFDTSPRFSIRRERETQEQDPITRPPMTLWGSLTSRSHQDGKLSSDPEFVVDLELVEVTGGWDPVGFYYNWGVAPVGVPTRLDHDGELPFDWRSGEFMAHQEGSWQLSMVAEFDDGTLSNPGSVGFEYFDLELAERRGKELQYEIAAACASGRETVQWDSSEVLSGFLEISCPVELTFAQGATWLGSITISNTEDVFIQRLLVEGQVVVSNCTDVALTDVEISDDMWTDDIAMSEYDAVLIVDASNIAISRSAISSEKKAIIAIDGSSLVVEASTIDAKEEEFQLSGNSEISLDETLEDVDVEIVEPVADQDLLALGRLESDECVSGATCSKSSITLRLTLTPGADTLEIDEFSYYVGPQAEDDAYIQAHTYRGLPGEWRSGGYSLEQEGDLRFLIWGMRDGVVITQPAELHLTFADLDEDGGPSITCPIDVILCGRDTSPAVTGEPQIQGGVGEIRLSYQDVEDSSGILTFARIWTATDSLGNSCECTQLIDTDPFTVIAPPDIFYQRSESPEEAAARTPAILIAQCDSTTLSSFLEPVDDCDCPGAYYEYSTVRDFHGNEVQLPRRVVEPEVVRIISPPDREVSFGDDISPESLGYATSDCTECQGFEITYEDEADHDDPGAFYRRWFAVGAMSCNVFDSRQLITYEEMEIECPFELIIPPDVFYQRNESPEVAAARTPATFIAQCDSTTLSSFLEPVDDCDCPGAYYEYLTVRDVHGNEVQVHRRVVEPEVVQIISPPDREVNFGEDISPESLGYATSDCTECQGFEITYEDEGDHDNPGSFYRRWFAVGTMSCNVFDSRQLIILDDPPPPCSGSTRVNLIHGSPTTVNGTCPIEVVHGFTYVEAALSDPHDFKLYVDGTRVSTTEFSPHQWRAVIAASELSEGTHTFKGVWTCSGDYCQMPLYERTLNVNVEY
ncbi:hypothetical protein ACFLSW_03680 [Candidatus Bipolaricaulota bacterium]